METAFGDPRAVPSAGDVLAFLAWTRDERSRRRAAEHPLHFAEPAAR